MNKRHIRVHEQHYLDELVYIVDTREHQPWVFQGHYSERGTIKTGDYSVVGPDGRSFLPGNGSPWSIAIERKSIGDLVGCLVNREPENNRDRFERELERAREIDSFSVICEFYYQDIFKHIYNSNMLPTAVFNSIEALQTRYKVPFTYAGNPTAARHVCRIRLRMYVRELIITGRIVVPEKWEGDK